MKRVLEPVASKLLHGACERLLGPTLATSWSGLGFLGFKGAFGCRNYLKGSVTQQISLVRWRDGDCLQGILVGASGGLKKRTIKVKTTMHEPQLYVKPKLNGANPK